MAAMTPKQASFRMPFEGDRHAATWMCWPLGPEEWQGQLPEARQEYAALVRAIAAVEKVELLIGDDDSLESARKALGADLNVAMHEQPLDDCWFRDSGPTFVRHSDGRVLPLCWRFNAWGEKYPHSHDALAARAQMQRIGIRPWSSELVMEGGSLEIDESGRLLTTRCCLLHPKRNPDWSESRLEEALIEALGLREVLWLDHGLEGDHTDGHIDTLTRFIGGNRVVTAVSARSDENFERLEHNRKQLEGYGLEVWELPIPERARHFMGVRLPETYANFYLCNGRVIVPQYGDAQDVPACEILQKAFPDHDLVALPASAIITSGGAFHCLTQQQPEGVLCDWE